MKIGLCMIVKNEEHVIREALDCTLGLIDTYSIVDTGSTDNTIQVIKNYYAEKKIHGEVHQRPWKNFGHNRSEAIQLCDGKMDYALVIDADDTMMYPLNGRVVLRNLLFRESPNEVLITFKQERCQYDRCQIMKTGDGWHYKGVLHEYPTNGKPNNKVIHLPSEFSMTCRHIGGRDKTGDKLQRDIQVLLQGTKDEPTNERYVFYLGQSYEDAGLYDDAVAWYTKRFEMGGWVEERYLAALRISRITKSKEWAWKAHEANPVRIESLVSWMEHCRGTNNWSCELLAMALYASSIPKPTGQILFLETDKWEWRVWDELAIIAYYCGRKDIAKKTSQDLLMNPYLPADQRERIARNLAMS